MKKGALEGLFDSKINRPVPVEKELNEILQVNVEFQTQFAAAVREFHALRGDTSATGNDRKNELRTRMLILEQQIVKRIRVLRGEGWDPHYTSKYLYE